MLQDGNKLQNDVNGVLSFKSIPQDSLGGDATGANPARKKKKKQKSFVRGRSPAETHTATTQLHEVKSQYNTSNKRFGSITQ